MPSRRLKARRLSDIGPRRRKYQLRVLTVSWLYHFSPATNDPAAEPLSAMFLPIARCYPRLPFINGATLCRRLQNDPG